MGKRKILVVGTWGFVVAILYFSSNRSLRMFREEIRSNKIQLVESNQKDVPSEECSLGNPTKNYQNVPLVVPDEDVLKIANSCNILYKRYGFEDAQGNSTATDKELNFPIAFVIQTHKNMHQVTTLLSAIYKRHNIYCIHLDGKVQGVARKAIQGVANCFPNVFMASKTERVVYASITRLLADINCMRDLLNVPSTMYDWKYLINLSGQDFPLKTNSEIVEQLMLLKGRNNIAGEARPDETNKHRTSLKYRVTNVTQPDGTRVEKIIKTNEPHDPPPFNMTVRKCLAYNVYTRKFLQWALVDSKEGRALIQWSYDTYSPDEHFWLMLNSHPGAPGGSSFISWWQVAMFAMWQQPSNIETCGGYWRHYLCIFGRKNLPQLTTSNKIFANKFDMEYDATVVKCLKEILLQRQKSKNIVHMPLINPPSEFFE